MFCTFLSVYSCAIYCSHSPMGSLLHGWAATKTIEEISSHKDYTLIKKCIRKKWMCKVSQYTSKYLFLITKYSLHIRYNFWIICVRINIFWNICVRKNIFISVLIICASCVQCHHRRINTKMVYNVITVEIKDNF
jgi:hypothetical protein